MAEIFRHVALQKYKAPVDDVTAKRIKEVHDDLGAQAPTVRAISHGPDLGVRPNGYDYGLVADFDDAEGWKAYSAHPAHDVVRSVMKDIVESAVVCQFTVTVPDAEK
ncbi:Dabb family protein [Pseudonocardia halophobica]|uniref:Dabb family protein n=1 Tax=Pseudonocardia halophobica TaxID=29401 RepID=UPI003D913D8D